MDEDEQRPLPGGDVMDLNAMGIGIAVGAEFGHISEDSRHQKETNSEHPILQSRFV